MHVINYLPCGVLDVGRLPSMLNITSGNLSLSSLIAAQKHPAGFNLGVTFLGGVLNRKYLAKNFIFNQVLRARASCEQWRRKLASVGKRPWFAFKVRNVISYWILTEGIINFLLVIKSVKEKSVLTNEVCVCLWEFTWKLNYIIHNVGHS